ncbi:aspartate aminotransferase family protein [Alphaproteobacteria bacterium LSUCC0684]
MPDQRRNLTLKTALDEARVAYKDAHSVSFDLFQKARNSMPGGNTRTVLHYSPFPFTVARGEGSVIWDAEGNCLTDFLGEYTAGLFGHSNPVIAAAIAEALEKGIVLGGPNLVESRFAQLICDRFHAVERLRFTNSGTESNMMAISAARAFTGREEILVMNGAYHGGLLSFEGAGKMNAPFKYNFSDYNDTDQAVHLIMSRGDALAAVIVEPMVGAGGGMPASAEFLGALRDATRKTGALLIFDEVMTSRHTGGGLQGFHQITPDLATFGKYIGGGLTLGAFGGRADIMDRFNPGHPAAWGHAGTFNNNILSMSAGYAGLSQVYTKEVADEFFRKGNAFRNALASDLARIDIPISVAGLGSMMVFHFRETPPEKPLLGKDKPPQELLELLHLDMIERGHFYARRGMINLSIETTPEQMQAFRHDLGEVMETRAPLIREVFGF